MSSVRESVRVLPRDRVKTKSGRHGWVRGISSGEVAHVIWDDGESFPIKFCHLEVLVRDVDMPLPASKK